MAHNNTQFVRERSNVYGHCMRAANELKTEEFLTFWRCLSSVEKKAVLVLDLKDVSNQIKESVYWFVLRYVLVHWNLLEPNSDLKGITKKEDSFVISVGKNEKDMMNQIVSAASTYDYCVMPSRDDSPCHVFSEPFEYTPTSLDDQLFFLSTLRFKMFLLWMVCDQMDNAFQLKRREMEADRVAALFLNEDVEAVKDAAKGKKKKRKPKAKAKKENEEVKENEPEAKAANTAPAEPEDQAGKPPSLSVLRNLTPREAMELVMEEVPSNLLDLVDLNCSIEESEEIQEESEVPKEEVNLAMPRVNRFLVGEGREMVDSTVVERKKKESVEVPFVSLREVLERKTFIEEIYEKEDNLVDGEVIMGDVLSSVVPTLISFQLSSSVNSTPILAPMMQSPSSSSLPKESPEVKRFTAASREFVMPNTPNQSNGSTGFHSYYGQGSYMYS